MIAVATARLDRILFFCGENLNWFIASMVVVVRDDVGETRCGRLFNNGKQHVRARGRRFDCFIKGCCMLLGHCRLYVE